MSRALGLVVVACAVVASVATDCFSVNWHHERLEGPHVELTADEPRADFVISLSPNGALRAAEANTLSLRIYARVVCDDAAPCSVATDGGVEASPPVIFLAQRMGDEAAEELASVIELPQVSPDAGTQYDAENIEVWNAQGEIPLRVFVRLERVDFDAGVARVTWDIVATASGEEAFDAETIEDADLFIVFEDPPEDFVPNLPASDAGVVDAGLD